MDGKSSVVSTFASEHEASESREYIASGSVSAEMGSNLI